MNSVNKSLKIERFRTAVLIFLQVREVTMVLQEGRQRIHSTVVNLPEYSQRRTLQLPLQEGQIVLISFFVQKARSTTLRVHRLSTRLTTTAIVVFQKMEAKTVLI